MCCMSACVRGGGLSSACVLLNHELLKTLIKGTYSVSISHDWLRGCFIASTILYDV